MSNTGYRENRPILSLVYALVSCVVCLGIAIIVQHFYSYPTEYAFLFGTYFTVGVAAKQLTNKTLAVIFGILLSIGVYALYYNVFALDELNYEVQHDGDIIWLEIGINAFIAALCSYEISKKGIGLFGMILSLIF